MRLSPCVPASQPVQDGGDETAQIAWYHDRYPRDITRDCHDKDAVFIVERSNPENQWQLLKLSLVGVKESRFFLQSHFKWLIHYISSSICQQMRVLRSLPIFRFPAQQFYRTVNTLELVLQVFDVGTLFDTFAKLANALPLATKQSLEQNI